MNILVVGATGGLGQEVVACLGRDGHRVTALVRAASGATFAGNVSVARGDVLDQSSLPPALAGQEGVICVLGTPSPRQASTLLREGTKNLADAMRNAGVNRVVCVTLLGAGSSRPNASLFYRQVILRVLAPMLADKEAQEQVVRESGLDWTIVRPPRFTDGKPRGELRVISEGAGGRLGRVVRADLAKFLVDTATRGDYVGQAVEVGS